VLAEAGSSVERFFGSGVLELKQKLGPVLWQLPPTKPFNPDDFTAFLELLPRTIDGRAIRHAVEVRHASFVTADFIALLRKRSVAPVLVDSEKHPMIADVTSDFVYARLQRTSEKVKTGYAPAALDDWAKRAETLAEGGTPDGVDLLAAAPRGKSKRDVFIYMISGAKVRAPAAAMALIERLK
jgi:uncharacterized protein YecE (DUF72 family)